MTEQLKAKLDYSIAILRKFEKLALIYDKVDGFYLGFSGGKDSQTLYHVAKMAGVRFKAHMALTSVDPPQVIRFVKTNYTDVHLIHPPASIYTVALKKKVLPTRVMRWCCDVFKEGHGAGKVKLIGIRHEESINRAKRQELEVTSYKFKGTQEEFAKWQDEQRAKQLEQMKKQHEQFDIDKESLVKCVGGKDSIIVSPIIDWTERNVWEFLNEVVKVPHCELYDTGHHRIGCLFCPMSTKRNLLKECKEYPHQQHRWIETIKEMRRNGALLNLDEHIDLSRYSEDEVAEFIFDWWICKTNSKKYVADKFLQQTINFNEI